MSGGGATRRVWFHPEIPVSDQQALVMESSVLAAGISASEPAVVATEIQATASSTLYNERQQPVTVHYRFFWYDARGLEMHPLDARRAPSWYRPAPRSRYMAAPISWGRIRSALSLSVRGNYNDENVSLCVNHSTGDIPRRLCGGLREQPAPVEEAKPQPQQPAQPQPTVPTLPAVPSVPAQPGAD